MMKEVTPFLFSVFSFFFFICFGVGNVFGQESLNFVKQLDNVQRKSESLSSITEFNGDYYFFQAIENFGYKLWKKSNQ